MVSLLCVGYCSNAWMSLCTHTVQITVYYCRLFRVTATKQIHNFLKMTYFFDTKHLTYKKCDIVSFSFLRYDEIFKLNANTCRRISICRGCNTRRERVYQGKLYLVWTFLRNGDDADNSQNDHTSSGETSTTAWRRGQRLSRAVTVTDHEAPNPFNSLRRFGRVRKNELTPFMETDIERIPFVSLII